MNNERAHCATLSNGTVVAQDSTASSTLNAAPRRRSTFVGGLVALAGICSLLMGCVAGESDFEGDFDDDEVEYAPQATQWTTYATKPNSATIFCTVKMQDPTLGSSGVNGKGSVSCTQSVPLITFSPIQIVQGSTVMSSTAKWPLSNNKSSLSGTTGNLSCNTQQISAFKTRAKATISFPSGYTAHNSSTNTTAVTIDSGSVNMACRN